MNYKEVMQQYELGPNGAIVTSLNLFATKFDKVLEILDERGKEHEHIIMDTPGQIEVFTWSASNKCRDRCHCGKAQGRTCPAEVLRGTSRAWAG